MYKKPYYKAGTAVVRAASAIKPVSKPAASKKLSINKIKEPKLVEPKGIESLPKHGTRLVKPSVIEKLWFVILVQDGETRVIKKGTQLECLERIGDLTEFKLDSHLEIFIANGFKIMGDE